MRWTACGGIWIVSFSTASVIAGVLRTPLPSGAFTLPVETGWTDNHLNLRFIIPGVTDKDFDLSVQGNQLVVRGERKEPKDFGHENAVWRTIPYGKFERVLDLPNGVNIDKLEARLHDGVLDVHIPLVAEVKPRKIEIQLGQETKKLAAA